MVPKPKGCLHGSAFKLTGLWRRITEYSPLPMAALEGSEHIVHFPEVPALQPLGGQGGWVFAGAGPV